MTIRNITDFILSKTQRLTLQNEFVAHPPGYRMFNTGGVEVEVGEFLYSLVKMLKPDTVLETGTHLGVSGAYIGAALQENGKGRLYTFEVIDSLRQEAISLWNEIGVGGYISSFLEPSLGQKAVSKTTMFDILFLDSEPQYRFDEFTAYFDQLKPGGLIIVHDLNGSMGHHGQTYHGTYDWPYGYFADKLGRYIEEFKVQSFHFPTPRGLSIFQKLAPGFETTNYLRKHCPAISGASKDRIYQPTNQQVPLTNKTIIFTHLFKNSGTSFMRSALLNYKHLPPGKNTYEVALNTWKNKLTEEEKRDIKFISGHAPFGFHKLLPHNNFTYISLFRDPIERALSIYSYLREEKCIGHPGSKIASKYSLIECFTPSTYRGQNPEPEAIFYELISNYQTRMLANTPGPCSSGIYGQPRPEPKPGECICDVLPITEEDYERAIRNIDKYFSFVGMAEDCDSIWPILQDRFGWKAPPENYFELANRPNETAFRIPISSISQEEYCAIQRWNLFDMRLLQYIKNNMAKINFRPLS